MENLPLFLSILSGLIMGVLGNILTPYVLKIVAKFSESVKIKNDQKRNVFEKSVQYLVDHPYDEIILHTEKSGYFLRTFLFLSSSLIVACFENIVLYVFFSIPLLFMGIAYYIKGNKYNKLIYATWCRRKQSFPDIDLE